jgi:SAM-dependent methyltransferase
VPRSSYYYQPRPESAENLRLLRQLDELYMVEYVDAATGKPLYEYHTFYLDPDLLEQPLLADAEGMRRVAGHACRDIFLVGGYTTYMKLSDALRDITGLKLNDADAILDWGCGCGRLTRHLLKYGVSTIQGADIDPLNVEWCRSNLPGRFTLLPLRPPSPFPHEQFNVVLGISVFTHLDEETQWLWLEELHRICSPGAILMLSIHGEASVARGKFNLAWLNKWMANGFDAGHPDKALNEVISDTTYYRVSFHTTDYIKRNWSKYFEILGIRDCFIGSFQDLVVLRKR